MNHVHFGAGNFGLGFVGWISNHLGLKLHLANRSDVNTGALSAQNMLIAKNLVYQIEHSQNQSETVVVSAFLNTDAPGDKARLLALIASPETMLVTTSLGGLPPPIITIIRDGLIARARAKLPPLFVVACENEVKFADLQKAIEGNSGGDAISTVARFVPCVVDRICRAVADDGDRVMVHAEQYGCLSLWHDSDLSLFREHLSARAAAAGAIGIEPSLAHLEFVERQKKWLINGPHLLLAINAYHDNHLAFDEYIRENRSIARGMLQEFAEGCFHVCAEGDELPIAPEAIRVAIEAKVEEVLTRFATFPDLTPRIMHRFVRPTERNLPAMQNFFRNMQYKIVEPARAYYESTGEMPHRMCDTLLKLIELIASDRFLPREE